MERHVSRRTVVKLAYAAPLVAATIRMDQRGASASAPCIPPCGRCFACSDATDPVTGHCRPIPGCVP